MYEVLANRQSEAGHQDKSDDTSAILHTNCWEGVWLE